MSHDRIEHLTAIERGGVLPTIASRCQEIRLRPSPRSELANALIESGTVVLVCDGQRSELEAGDCVTFDADLPHHFENPSDKDRAVLLAVVSAGLRRS